MASESLAALSNISNGMFAGGAVAFGVAALVLSFVKRTRRPHITHVNITEKKKVTSHEVQGKSLTSRELGGKDKKEEIFVNPIDVWAPTDLERALKRIPGPPSLMEELEIAKDINLEGLNVDEIETSPLESEDSLREMSSSQMDSEASSIEVLSSPISPNERAANKFTCTSEGCSKTYQKQYELNHHMRCHDKSKTCPTCPESFATTKDLNRHINSVHQTTKRFYCTVARCKYARLAVGGASFARKDNWRRHMRDKHGRGNEEMGQGDDMDVDE